MISRYADILSYPVRALILPTSRIYLLYVISYVAIVFALWRKRRPAMSFAEFIFPRSIYQTRQFLIDIGFFYCIALFTAATNACLSPKHHADDGFLVPAGSVTGSIAFTFFFFIIFDFVAYMVHFMQHKIPALWKFHAVHHQPKALHPLVAFRHHPVDILVQIFTYGLVAGILSRISPVFAGMFYNANVFILAFYCLGYHLRHSHIPLEYPRWLSFLISPSQHQLHHSALAKYYDRNMGFTFSLWDRMFGTLYIPSETSSQRVDLKKGITHE